MSASWPLRSGPAAARPSAVWPAGTEQLRTETLRARKVRAVASADSALRVPRCARGHDGQYVGMDVALARDRRRVGEPPRSKGARLLDLERGLFAREPRLDDRDRADPRAKRLGADLGLAGLAQIVVELRRVDLLDAVGRAVAKQPLPRQLLAAKQDPREAPIADGDLR